MARIRNVVRSARERIDSDMPDASRIHRQFEVERLPEHIHHHVQVGIACKPGDRARQRPPMRIVEARVP
jgi:hypothetical protein